MTKIVLSIDCGTQSLRSMLFDTEGTLLAKEKIEYPSYYSEKPGWAEQEPTRFWDALCQTCKSLSISHPDLFNKIEGVGVTTQRDSMINLDVEGKPLRPVITWLDQRKAKPVYEPNFIMKSIFKAIGMYESLLKTQMDGKCNWIMQNQPEIWEKTFKYLQVSGFLNYKLTGNYNDSIASQIGHIPFNYKKMRWASGNELPNYLFRISRSKLPDLIKPGEIIGNISKQASLLTGIPENIPVIACGSDKGCETIGMGVIDTTMASISFGTTATVQTMTKKYFEVLKHMPAYPATLPGYYNPEVEIFRGYWMITWFKNEFGHKEIQEAESRGLAPELLLNKLLEEVPAGSMGLMMQPYWSPGLKTPSAKGAMIGFGDVHQRPHIYKAIIEGLAFALKEGLHKIEKSGKTKIQKLAVSGGASQSDEICQISADIFNLPLMRGKTFETSGLGAAIIISAGIGEYPDIFKAIEKMVHYDKVFNPDVKHVDLYKHLYERVYKKIYPSLEHLYKEIRDIINYPEKIN